MGNQEELNHVHEQMILRQQEQAKLFIGNSLFALGLSRIKRTGYALSTKEQAASYIAWFKNRGWRQGDRMPMIKEKKP